MTKAIELNERLSTPGMQGVDIAGVHEQLDRSLRLVEAEVTRGSLPVVCNLGYHDHWRTLHPWELVKPDDGEDLELPTNKREPVVRIESINCRLAVVRKRITYQYRMVWYDDQRRQVTAKSFPAQPDMGYYELVEPFSLPNDPEKVPCDIIRIAQYKEGNMAVELSSTTMGPQARLSVNLPEEPIVLRPGHFWVKTWMETEPVVKILVNNGLLLLSGTWTTGDNEVVAAEGCLNYRKLKLVGGSAREHDATQGSERG
jgi:hypothetical protein